MALKAFITKLEEAEEQYRDLYVESEDGFVLDIEDKDFKKKLEEFRTTNRKLMKEKEKLTKEAEKFKNIDPEKYKEATEALERLEQLEDKDLLKQGKLDELIDKRVGAMKTEYERQVKAKDDALTSASQERDKLRGRLEKTTIDSTLQTAIAKVGTVRKGAMDDVLNRGRRTWAIDEDGHMVPKNRESGETVYGPKGDPQTPEEWAQDLLNTASHLFESSSGGGAEGGKKGTSESKKTKEIDRNDVKAFGANLEGIAKGEVTVRGM